MNTRTRNNKIDMEKLFLTIGMSLMGGFGFLMLTCGLFQIDLFCLSGITIAGLILGMSGIVFGLLLLIQGERQ